MLITCSNCGFDNLASDELCVKCHIPLRKQDGKLIGSILRQGNPLTPDNPTTKKSQVGTIPGKQAFGENLPPPVLMSPPTLPDSAYRIPVPTPPPPPNDSSINEGVKKIVCPYPDCGFINIAPRKTCIKCQRNLFAAEISVPPPNVPTEESIKTKEEAPLKTPQNMKTIDPYRMRAGNKQKCYMGIVPKMDETIPSGMGTAFELSADERVELNRDNIDPSNGTITSKVQAELSFENGRWFLIDRSEQKTTFVHVSEKTEIKDGDTILMGDRRLIFRTDEAHKKRMRYNT